MAVLTRDQFVFLDKLFYNAPALQQAVDELRVLRKADAQDSADPTAREAVAGLEEIPVAMTYERPEAWLRVVESTWQRYHGTLVGDVMCRRYKLREWWLDTVHEKHIAENTYFRWRQEFILSAALIAARDGLL